MTDTLPGAVGGASAQPPTQPPVPPRPASAGSLGITDVAKLAGVSAATVSRALSGNGRVSAATRAKVERVAQELGYVVSSNASSLASGRTRNVGVVIPYLNTWYFSTLVEGAAATLRERGYDLTLYVLDGGGAQARESVFENFLLRKRVDAVLAVALELTDDEVARLLTLGKPLVCVGGLIPGVRSLVIDNERVSALATEHLIGLGHTRVAHVGGAVELDADFHLGSARRLGYDTAMARHGLATGDDLYAAADFTMQGGYHAAKQLLGRPDARPTAIVAASDEMAIGCLLAARDLGLSVPRDVSVIGVDDHELSPFFGLTTVAQHPDVQGRRAVDVLMTELQPHEGDSALQIDLPYELVVRSTTARPPAP
ncbi:LacI family DNA-binding transcriptional regulator [Gryllotalpicola daejeonensis]|uniref:LacI family DNA-binding transcriptional regulator n=1 Tax=Gryllotalpicola daejeonensis TaxID=993087 RepID=A0ABP7ZM15_9MICO